jgi:hypothetical protein
MEVREMPAYVTDLEAIMAELEQLNRIENAKPSPEIHRSDVQYRSGDVPLSV